MLRRLLVLASALLVLPATANAAPNWSQTTVTSTGAYTSGELVTLTVDIVNTGDAPPANIPVQLTDRGISALAVEGPVTATDGPGPGADRSASVTTTAGSHAFTITTGFAAGDARVTFSVRLPKAFRESFRAQVTGLTGGPFRDEIHTVSKGGPSKVRIDRPGEYRPAVTKDSTHVSTYRVTNYGPGVAEFVTLRKNVYSSPERLFSPTPPPFDPKAAYASGCAAVLEAGNVCEIGSLASGASAEVTISFTDLTHYGEVSLDLEVRTADNARTGDVYDTLFVGDGQTAQISGSIRGPRTAAGGTDVTYTGNVRVFPGAPLGTSTLLFHASSFAANGYSTSQHEHALASIKSITLSNGATCTSWVDTTVVPNVTYLNEWRCPLTGVAEGTTLTYALVANFPTTIPNQYASIEVDLRSITRTFGGYYSTGTTLNPAREGRLDLLVALPKVVGANRGANAVLTIRNTGSVGVVGGGADLRILNGSGSFVEGALPAGCESSWHEFVATCVNYTRLAPGESRSWTIPLRTSQKLGQLALLARPGEWNVDVGDGHVVDWEGAHHVAIAQIVRPADAPFAGVRANGKLPVRNAKQLANAGLSSSYRCPRSCRGTVQLRVSRAAAKRVGLIPNRGANAGFVVIGSGVRARGSAGNVVVVARPTRAYKAKLAKLRKAVPVQVVATVVSTHASDKDARWTSTRTLQVRPARR